MRGSGEKLCFDEMERGKVCKYYMKQIMNEENNWDRNVEGDAVEGPVVYVSREKVFQALNENRKSPWNLEVSLELIAASGGVGIQIIAKICQNVVDRF